MANIIEQLDAEQMTREVPEFGPGDTVVVQVKVKEGPTRAFAGFWRVSSLQRRVVA